MVLKIHLVKCLSLLLLGFSCIQIAYGFQVKMENHSGKTLNVSCRTHGQKKPVTAKLIRRSSVTVCKNGAPSLKSWYSHHHKKNRLIFSGLDEHSPFQSGLSVTFLNKDNSIHCIVHLNYWTSPLGKVWFFVKNYHITKDYPGKCTTDYYTHGRRIPHHITIRIH